MRAGGGATRAKTAAFFMDQASSCADDYSIDFYLVFLVIFRSRRSCLSAGDKGIGHPVEREGSEDSEDSEEDKDKDKDQGQRVKMIPPRLARLLWSPALLLGSGWRSSGLWWRVGVAIVVLSWLSSCRLWSGELTQPAPSGLSRLSDDQYELLLTYSEREQTYEFMTCLEGAADAAELAQRCVPAFRGPPRGDSCRDYVQFKSVCDQMGPLQQFCMSEDAGQAPGGYSRDDCTYVQATIEQCELALPLWAGHCGSWYEQRHECLRSGGQNEGACGLFRRLTAEPIRFKMQDPQLDEAARAEFEWVLNYQLSEQAQSGDPLRFLGSGAALAFLHPSYGKSLQALVPNPPQFFQRQLGFGPLKSSLKNVVGALAQVGLIIGSERGSENLLRRLIYTPQVGCVLEASELLFKRGDSQQDKDDKASPMRQQVPMGSTAAAAQTLRDGFMYGGLGYVSNMAVLRLTRSAVAPVRVGSLMVIPFMSLYFSHQQSSSRGAAELARHFDAVFGHALQQAEVSDLEDAVRVLGRSLVVSSQAQPFEIQEYCLPQPDAGGPVAACSAVLTPSDGILYDLAYKRSELQQGSCATSGRDLSPSGL